MGDPKTYFILTNNNEIQVYNAINKLKKLNSKFTSVNKLKIYNKVIDILLNPDNNDLSTVSNELNNIDYNSLKTNEIYWDNDYKYTNINKDISDIKESLNDNYSKELLIKEQTNINKQLDKIYVSNNAIDEEIENVKRIADSILTNNENLKAKYLEDYLSITRSFVDSKYNNNILNIVTGKEVYNDDTTTDKNYLIIVGSKLPVNRQIDNKVNEINELYASLVNTETYQVEILYCQIMLEFAGEFNNNPEQNKSLLLESIKGNNESYNNAEDSIKEKIDELIDNIKNNNDQNYLYTEDDINELNNLLASTSNKLEEQTELNNKALAKITALKAEIDELEAEYKELNNGEEYEHAIIDEDQAQEIDYTIVDTADDIYSSTVDFNISFNKTNIVLSYTEQNGLIATISPDNIINKTINWTTSDNNVVTISQEQTQSGEENLITWQGIGNAVITATSDLDNSKYVTCQITCSEQYISVTNITLDYSEIELDYNATCLLAATVEPDNATNKTITWESSDPNIANISQEQSQSGEQIAIMWNNVGQVTITAHSADAAVTTCTIICKPQEVQPITYTVTLNINNGTADAYEKEVNEGETVQFEITPNNGYTLEGAVIENGILEGNIVKLENVHENATIVVTCQEEQVEPPVQQYYFYVGLNDNNTVLDENYNINPELVDKKNDISEIASEQGITHTFDTASDIILPEEWYNQIVIKNEIGTPLADADAYRKTINGINYIILENSDLWATKLIFVLVGENQGGIPDVIPSDKGEQEIEPVYYWYVGSIQPTASNYTSIATQVTSYEYEFMWTPNERAYQYALVKDNKTVQFIDPSFNVAVDTSIDTDTISGYKIFKSITKLAVTPIKIKIS